jgi:hypothetical protein
MAKKKEKRGSSRPLPKPNRQIPISMIRPLSMIGNAEALEHARDYPLYGCWVTAGWEELGIAPVIVARKQDDDHVLFGDYMVDFYCLGVKDVFTRTDIPLERFERDLAKLCQDAPEPISASLAHEMIYGALEYSAKLGFQPHPDFYNQKADRILDPPDAYPRNNGVEFGKDGKPLFIAGPYDDERKIKSVLNSLTRTCGEGNFHFLVGL